MHMHEHSAKFYSRKVANQILITNLEIEKTLMLINVRFRRTRLVLSQLFWRKGESRECVKLAWNSQLGIRFEGFLGLELGKWFGLD